MGFTFATCDRTRALEFLKILYPSSVVLDSSDSVSDLLDIIEADEIRITDPGLHKGQIIQSKNWRSDTAERTQAALIKSGLAHIRNDHD